MPFSVLNRWRRFDEIEPINPAIRLEWMLAQLTAFTYNPWRGKDQKALTAEDFLPVTKAAQPEASPEDKAALLRFWAIDQKMKMGTYVPPWEQEQK